MIEKTVLICGMGIASLEQDPRGVRVEFEKIPARRFGLVIGADGLHSRIRALVFGPQERERAF